jgi:membrane associated rhomboid family serine protease
VLSALYNRFVSAGGPDLFVVCKNCGSEVSPYITECPYCGGRLRKRAPKIDRDGRVTEGRRRRRPSASLPRLRSGEIPGIRVDSRPYATILIVLASALGAILYRTGLFSLDQSAVWGARPWPHHVWRLLTATLTYDNAGYAFAALVTLMLFGWLLERRHGPLVPLALFVIGGVGGTAAAAALSSDPFVLGGNGAALAMLCAWAVPDLISLAAGEELDSDLIGVAVMAVAVALMPLADTHASWVADGAGAGAGLLLGYPIARISGSW